MNMAQAGIQQHRPQTGGFAIHPTAFKRPCLSDLLDLMGVTDWDRQWTDELPLELHRVRAGMALFHEGATAEHTYVVRCGTFKCIHTTEDGYEQVLCFAGAAEVLGFDALHLGRHPNSAVALEDASAYALTNGGLAVLRRRVPALDEALQMALSRQLAHGTEIAEMMAAVAAEVRLARFIVQLSERAADRGESPRRMHLRMCRRDIASYLGVAHETVSRSFTALADFGHLRVDNRELEILDLEGLRELSHSTRRLDA